MFYRFGLMVLLLFTLIGCGDEGVVRESSIHESSVAAAPSAPSLMKQACPLYLYKNTTMMRYVPGGSFTMGGAYDTDEHRIPEWTAKVDGFYMDVHEVTIGDFLLFLEMTDHDLHWSIKIPHFTDAAEIENDPDFFSHPVRVSWYDAVAYAEWVGKRLPTEVEWERAARAGREDVPITGNVYIATLSDISRFPWDTGFMFDDMFVVKPVGSYSPNPYGLFDMIGNVDEWCSDEWNTNAYLLLMNDMIPQWVDNGEELFGHIPKVSRGGGVRHNVDMVSKYSGKVKEMDTVKQRQFLKATIHVGERTMAEPFRAVGFRCVLDMR